MNNLIRQQGERRLFMAATLYRRTRRQRVQAATPTCRHGNADLHKNPLPPNKASTLAGCKPPLVGMGMPTYK